MLKKAIIQKHVNQKKVQHTGLCHFQMPSNPRPVTSPKKTPKNNNKKYNNNYPPPPPGITYSPITDSLQGKYSVKCKDI